MEQRFYSWLSRIFRILFVCKDVFLSVLYASYSPFFGIVVVESFSHFVKKLLAYWPIVIVLTEHSLSSYPGPAPAYAGVCHSAFIVKDRNLILCFIENAFWFLILTNI